MSGCGCRAVRIVCCIYVCKNGMDVCVIDKAIFPRDKLCGGLLTRRTKQCFLDVFGTGWEDIHECWSNGALFFHKGQMINAIENYGELFFAIAAHSTMRCWKR